MMDNVGVFKALSSASRWNILKTLSTKPMSITEIAEEVALKPITVRHHLQTLIQEGLVEIHEEIRGVVGRPEVYYRVADRSIMVSFPERDYLLLSGLLVDGLSAHLGEEQAKQIFTKIGEEAGVAYVNGLAAEHGIEEWTAESFGRIFVEGLLNEMGTKPEIVSQDENEITYLERNCLFLELAKSNPEPVCNGLDSGFHAGIVKGLGPDVEGKRLKCMGHGDGYCEYHLRWKN